MKTLLLITFLFLSSLNADFLYTKTNTCISSYWYDQTTNGLHMIESKTQSEISINRVDYQQYILSGYSYDSLNDVCFQNPNLLGVSEENFEYINGVIAVFTSFLLAWSLL